LGYLFRRVKIASFGLSHTCTEQYTFRRLKDELLAEQWQLYDINQNIQCMPNRATYMSVMTCWAWCGEGNAAARRTEELLEEMESYRKSYSTTLSPIC
jgi:hypothetical protein